MSIDALDNLLDKLCTGDDAAAEEVFRAYEPYLRVIVRRMLPPPMRSKFDSVDVVQSVWADVLRGFREGGWRFSTSVQLRAFLVKATRNRFIDRARQNRAAVQRQQPLSDEALIPDDVDTPGELVQAEELWDRMVTLCPPAHRELLQLKRQGCSLAEIAERTGLHPSSVRRILYDLARRLAADP
ncbi:MAG: sigma-70 family RNA polymerase sigma factor [Gemmataceae bacterium]|nr:sigma-70 family RNA polymerase sigma factor [Gemmataceae bacterium]